MRLKVEITTTGTVIYSGKLTDEEIALWTNGLQSLHIPPRLVDLSGNLVYLGSNVIDSSIITLEFQEDEQ